MFLKRLFRRGKPVEQFPLEISQSSGSGNVQFEVFSRVEKYRIAEYGGEQEFLEKFIAALKPDDVLFDIGASIGLMTVHAAAALGSGKVFAFEPDPETRSRLKNNVARNELTNVTFIEWAASDAAGEVVLYSDGAAGFAPSLRKQSDRAGAPKGEVRVMTKTIDSAVTSGELPLPTVLKIDIEGAEVLCLRGANNLLSGELGERPRLVFLELHPEFIPDFGATPEAVHASILEHGYSVVWESRRDDQVHYCYAASKTADN